MSDDRMRALSEQGLVERLRAWFQYDPSDLVRVAAFQSDLAEAADHAIEMQNKYAESLDEIERLRKALNLADNSLRMKVMGGNPDTAYVLQEIQAVLGVR